MPLHLEKRRRRWYAILDIPKALRSKFGGKRRFLRTLETPDLTVAQRRRDVVIAGWQAELDRARGIIVDDSDTAYFRRLLREATTPAQRDTILEQIGDAADAVGYLYADTGQPPSSAPEAQEFVGRATGAYVSTLEHVEEWLATLHSKPRTKDQRRTGAKRVGETFPMLRDINKPAVRRWASGLDLSRRSITLILGGMRVYWRWLQAVGIATEGANPFEGVDLVRGPPEGKRVPFAPQEVGTLRDAADPQLRDLITLAMWTGCRIEELCSLEVAHVGPESFRVADAKTAAGVRVVPIHPKLQQTMARLIQESTDGYIMAGLHLNKYGDRSSTPGRRFSTMKKRLGFGPYQVFHSIRRCVVTQLENAGAPENVVADIVGHEKPRITYGLYSGGATLEVKAAALALLDYPAEV